MANNRVRAGSVVASGRTSPAASHRSTFNNTMIITDVQGNTIARASAGGIPRDRASRRLPPRWRSKKPARKPPNTDDVDVQVRVPDRT